MLLRKMLEIMVKEGSLTLVDAAGKTWILGNGSEPRCTIRIHDQATESTIPINPALRFAEAYMEGRLSFQEGTLEDFLALSLRNWPHLEKHWTFKVGRAIHTFGRRLGPYNPIPKAKRNVAHHYDLSGQLYDLFLDKQRQYSCAYFTEPHDDLDRAQQDKLRHLAAKLLIDRPNLDVLDIGSGWGGLGLYLAQVADCDVTGLTLSTEQLNRARAWAKSAGLEQRVRFHYRDYREQDGRFDRIISVGMFEHVGQRHYKEFFRKVGELLRDDGVCLIHAIGRFVEAGPVNSFITKYIFPGGQLPSLSQVMPAIEQNRLLVTDIEVLRLHYAETLRLWHERFMANRDKVVALYDERFCRMWELYLKGCEIAFRTQDLMVFQIQLAKAKDSVPLTRDYIYEWEHGGASQRIEAAE